MTGNDNLLVGVIALGLVPFIGLRILRALRTGVVPLYRTYLNRDDDRAKFAALIALHGVSLLLMAAIGVDLIFDLGWLRRA